jgi:ubiquitin C
MGFLIASFVIVVAIATLSKEGAKTTLADFGIEHGDKLTMTMEILVVTPTGDIVVVRVSPSDTIDEIKDKVKEQTGIEPDDQDLMFNGQMLDDGSKTLSEYGIEDGSKLTMMIKIFVVPLTGEKLTLFVSPSESIDEIKDRVKEPIGMEPDQQHLTFADDLLDDGTKTLEDCSIENEDTLFMSLKISVVTPEGETVDVYVHPSDTIDEIKDKIKDKTGIEPEDQHLVFNGQPLDDGSKPLSEYGVGNGDTINMMMRIYVVPLTGEKNNTLRFAYGDH